MSPEQAQALPDVDLRSDLWSVGAILFESLSGRAPHSGTTYEQVIVHICTKDIDDVRMHNPLVSAEVAAVLKKALTRDRDARYGSAREMLDALVAASEGSLSPSLASDSLRRAVIRPPTKSSGSPTLAAVSTVAATPGPPGVSTASAPSGPRGVYMLVGAVAIGLGGVIAGVTLGRGGGGGASSAEASSTAVRASLGPRPPRPAHPDAESTASAAAASAVAPSASASSDPAGANATDSAPSASSSAAPPPPPPASAISLRARTAAPHESAKPPATSTAAPTATELQLKDH
jgi:serine/threonine-protein kinase